MRCSFEVSGVDEIKCDRITDRQIEENIEDLFTGRRMVSDVTKGDVFPNVLIMNRCVGVRFHVFDVDDRVL